MLTKDLLNRAFHTFWQAFVVVFLAGLTNVFGAFQHNLGSGKSALLALSLSAVAAGLSALKSAYLNSKK
jgi:hypothetical protein